MMIMSVGEDYISELWPPTGLFFAPQVTYEHGEPWWNDFKGMKLKIRPPQLSGNPTSRVIEEQSRKNWMRKR
jgi:hypothetical protein